jgi:hypothetical protein
MSSIRGTSPPGRPSSPLILAAHLSFIYLDVHTATARVRLARDLRLGVSACCRTVRSDLEFQRVYEFLSQLRKEFEPRRAQLLARGRVPISEVLSELRAEETRLRGAGFR